MSNTPKDPTPAAGPAPVLFIPLAHLQPSPSNPRKQFEPAVLADLAASIRARGIIQPLVVRPLKYELDGTASFEWILVRSHPGVVDANDVQTVSSWPKKQEAKARAAFEPVLQHFTHEIVCGEQRWRAAKQAGLEAVPCVVRLLDDKTVLELQVIENLQRAGLHPLEEAEGYERLMKQHGYKLEDLEAKIGKSRSYVYARLKLTALCDVARKAFYAGRLNPSTALLVARIPHEDLQKQAVKRLWDDWQKEPTPYREAARLVQEEYMLALKEAPFDVKADLPGGPCAACPKRTGNQKELFADVTSADVCTDPKCFAAKREAWAKQGLAVLAQEGVELLSPEDTQGAFRYSHSGEVYGLSRFADASAACPEDPKKRTYAQLVKDLGPKAPAVHGAVDPTGKVRRLVEKNAFVQVFKAAGKGLAKDSPAARRMEHRARAIRSAREEELRQAEADAIMAGIVWKLEALTVPLPVEFWRALIGGLDESYLNADETRRRRKEQYVPALAVKLKTPGQLLALLAELCIDDHEESCSQVAKALKVDTKAIAKKVDAEFEAKEKAKEKPTTTLREITVEQVAPARKGKARRKK